MPIRKIANLYALLLLVIFVRAQNCYHSNGDVAQYDRPCNSSIGSGYQTCCGPNYDCTDANLCVANTNSQTYFGRGSCTDSTFGDNNCPRFCLAANMTGVVDVCAATLRDTHICCYTNGSNTCDCNSGGQILGPLHVYAREPSGSPTTGFASALPLSSQFFYIQSSGASPVVYHPSATGNVSSSASSVYSTSLASATVLAGVSTTASPSTTSMSLSTTVLAGVPTTAPPSTTSMSLSTTELEPPMSTSSELSSAPTAQILTASSTPTTMPFKGGAVLVRSKFILRCMTAVTLLLGMTGM